MEMSSFFARGILAAMKDGEIKHKLSPAQVSVMQHRVTEPPYFGKYWDHFDIGRYRCAACDTLLFTSEEKFDSKTGWPSFKKPLSERDLQFKSEPGPDDKIEIRCKKCKSHLGYVIAGETPYYRINSVCLIFEPVVPVIAPLVTDAKPPSVPLEQKSEPVIIASSDTPVAPVRKMSSVAAGFVLGAIVGAFAMTYFTAPTAAKIPPTATSSTDIATSSAATSTASSSGQTVTPKTKTAPRATPALNDNPPVSNATDASSTQ